MGTSLSGLTPATTFDGLLKVGDNDPLTATLKPISTGDGTDTILQLSNSELKVAGQFNVDTGADATIINTRGASLTIEQTFHSNNNTYNSIVMSNNAGIFLKNGNATALTAKSAQIGIGEDTPTSRLHVKSSGNSSTDYALKILNSDNSTLFDIRSDSAIRIAPNSTNAVSFRNAKMQDGNAVFGTTTIPASTRMTIKGQGASVDTTSLLVQDSAGSELFKLTDDGNINLGEAGASVYIQAAKNIGKSLKLGNQAHLSSFDTIDFKTYDGVSYSEVMRITGNTDQFVGIGETTPTARLHVKGSGATSATTSLLVQNSTGADVLQTLDNGSVGVGGPANSSYRVTMTSGVLRLKDLLFGQADSTAINNTSLLTMKWNGSTGIGISGGGAIDATARLHVKGSGNDNTTTSLLVQNSDGTDGLYVKDALEWGIGYGNNNKIDGNNNNLYIRHNQLFFMTGGSYFAKMTTAGFQVGNGAGTPTARLQVKGSGATSATTALLVQNSAGTELLKVLDDGAVSATTFYAGTSIIRQNSFRINQQWLVSGTGGQGLKIGTSNTAPDNSAKLEVESTTQGFLPPRMTDAEKNAIATPAAGLMVYDTDANQMSYWNGGAWVNF